MGLSAFNAMRAREKAKLNAEKPVLKVEEAPVKEVAEEVQVEEVKTETETTSATTKKTDAEKLKRNKNKEKE